MPYGLYVSGEPYCFIDGVTRRYFKNWNQPKLTSNTSYGVMTSTTEYKNANGEAPHPPWMGFNGITTTDTEINGDKYLGIQSMFNGEWGGDIEWILPNNEKIHLLEFQFLNTDMPMRYPSFIEIYGSNDNAETWTKIGRSDFNKYLTNPDVNFLGSVYCNYSVAYNAILIALGKSYATDNLTGFSECYIKAYKEGTQDDYDYFKDDYALLGVQ